MQPLVVVAVLMFIGASLHDLRERRVRNRYWVPFVAAAAIHWSVLLAEEQATLPLAAWAVGSSGLFYGLWRLGLYGGADAKGLIVLAWLVPATPSLDGSFTFALDGLVNATLVMLALPIGFLLWNSVRGDARLPAMLLGVRMSTDRARSMQVWPMQVLRDGKLAWRYRMPRSDDVGAQWDDLARHGQLRPWVTPKVPFMLPLTTGVLLAAAFGNLVVQVMIGLVAKASV